MTRIVDPNCASKRVADKAGGAVTPIRKTGGTNPTIAYSSPYNRSVNDLIFEQMKRYVSFSESDASVLAGLARRLGPQFPTIVAEFYAVLQRDERAVAVFAGDLAQIERLHKSLNQWLVDLFGGRYGEEYHQQRREIGHTHVRVHLPQYLMFTAMNVIRLALLREIRALADADVDAQVAAVEKILDLELAIMNQAYHEELMEHLRQLESARFERRLNEARHLASIGELAASVAHEIKNPLAGISGALQVIRGALDESHPHREVMDEALKQIDRLDSAVKDLLVYARPKPPKRSPIDLVSLMDRVLMILREEPAFSEIALKCDTDPSPIEVNGDESQLQQVLMNIVINAAHACGPSGTVICVLRRQPDGAHIAICDDGIGIDPDVLLRVWEPFFTTKAKGTGLGLSICHRIIESHGGSIRLESEPGQGTRVLIDLHNGESSQPNEHEEIDP